MQALVLQYPNDPNTYNIDDQYFFGRDLLVCPVTVKGAKTRTLYLPKGEWYDYWSGKKIEGGRYINVVTPLENMPVFARAGAIIPMQPDMLYEGEKPLNPLTLDIYPSSGSTFNLYEDDGLTLDYQQGKYALTKIDYKQDNDIALIDIQSPEGEFQLPDRTFIIKLHTEEIPAWIEIENKNITESSEVIGVNKINQIIPAWKYNKESKLLYITGNQKSGRSVSVKIQY